MGLTPEQQRLDIISEAIGRLLKKQDELEQRIARLEGKAAIPKPAAASAMEPAPAMAEPASLTPKPEPAALFPPSEPPPSPSAPPPKKPALETKVGLTVVNRIGVITLVLGVAFFFKWAVDNDWIGPAGRVILGVIAAFAALAAADFLWRKGQQIFAQ